MSVKTLVWAWNLKIKIASHKLVLLTLADNANEQGECFPKLETIGKRCGLKDRQLRYVIRELHKQGYLEFESRHKKNGAQSSNLYALNINSKFDTIDDDTLHHSASPPCTTVPRPPAPQTLPPLAQNAFINNKNNNLKDVQNQQLKALTKSLTKDKRYCASDDAHLHKNENAQNEKRKDTGTVKAKAEHAEAFDRFWALYPVKKNKARAKKKWERINPDLVPIILADVSRRSAEDSQWRFKKYIPHPGRYLDNERWLDEITPHNPKIFTNTERSHKSNTNVAGHHENRPVAQFWGPGHPGYDEMHRYKIN